MVERVLAEDARAEAGMMLGIGVRGGRLQPVVRLGQTTHVRLHLGDLARMPQVIYRAVVVLEQRRINFITDPFVGLHVGVGTFGFAGGAAQKSTAGSLASAVPAGNAVSQPERALEIVNLRRPERLLGVEILLVPRAAAVFPHETQRLPTCQIFGFPKLDAFVVVPEWRNGAGDIPHSVRSLANRSVAQRRVHQLPQFGRNRALSSLAKL